MTDVVGSNNLADGAVNYLIQNTVNDNISRMLASKQTINFSSDADYALSETEGSEEWRYLITEFTDTGTVLTATRGILYPDKRSGLFIVINSTAQSLVVRKNESPLPTGVTITTGNGALVYYDGDDVKAIVNPLP